MVLRSILRCPPFDFWKGFWATWSRTVQNPPARREAVAIMDTPLVPASERPSSSSAELAIRRVCGSFRGAACHCRIVHPLITRQREATLWLRVGDLAVSP